MHPVDVCFNSERKLYAELLVHVERVRKRKFRGIPWNNVKNTLVKYSHPCRKSLS